MNAITLATRARPTTLPTTPPTMAAVLLCTGIGVGVVDENEDEELGKDVVVVVVGELIVGVVGLKDGVANELEVISRGEAII